MNRLYLTLPGALVLHPAAARAQEYWPSEIGYYASMPEEGVSSIVRGFFQFFLIITIITAIVLLVYSGILYIISRGKIDEQRKARDIATWTLIGMVVVFLAFAIVSVVVQLPLFSGTGDLDVEAPVDPRTSTVTPPAS